MSSVDGHMTQGFYGSLVTAQTLRRRIDGAKGADHSYLYCYRDLVQARTTLRRERFHVQV